MEAKEPSCGFLAEGAVTDVAIGLCTRFGDSVTFVVDATGMVGEWLGPD